MPYKFYTDPETPIVLQDASLAQTGVNLYVNFSPKGLPPGSGWISNKIDLGAAPRTSIFLWKAVSTTQVADTVGNYIDMYMATMDDADFGTIDAYLPGSGNPPPAGDVGTGFVSYDPNRQWVGRLMVDNTQGSGDSLISSGLVEITQRYCYLFWFNSTKSNLVNNASRHLFTLTPIPAEVQ